MTQGVKSVLIFGGSGFVGTHLAMSLRNDYKVYATYFSHPIQIPGVTFIPCHVSRRDWMQKMITTIQPDIVISALGNPDLQWCMKNPKDAERVHADGPSSLALIVGMNPPLFIFLSNSYVFDGTHGNYHENEITLSSNLLGKLTSSTESVIRSKCMNYLILRSSPIFGRGNGKNLSFLDRLRMSLDRNQRFEAPHHELHSFVYAPSFIAAVKALIQSGIKNKIFHFGGLTKLTHYEFSRRYAKFFGYDEMLISIQPQKEAPTLTPERGVLDFSLNSTLSYQTLKVQPLLLEESFNLIQQELIPEG